MAQDKSVNMLCLLSLPWPRTTAQLANSPYSVGFKCCCPSQRLALLRACFQYYLRLVTWLSSTGGRFLQKMLGASRSQKDDDVRSETAQVG